jgi:hypothetical protein
MKKILFINLLSAGIFFNLAAQNTSMNNFALTEARAPSLKKT